MYLIRRRNMSESKVRNVDSTPSTMFSSMSGGHIPKKMTWREYCYYNDEGLTLQEIKFADAYTQTPDLIKAALAADVEEQIAKAWAKATIAKPQVKRRIEDNLSMARRSSVMSVRERQEQLTSIARASIADCITIKNGRMEIDLEKAKKHGSHKGIVSIKIDDKEDTQGGQSRSRSIQMSNPMAAISELNKMDIMYDKKVNTGSAVVLIPVEDMAL
jgi:phage terminase small subunit